MERAHVGNGFTLVEVVVAMLVLAVGLLGLVATSALTARMIGRSRGFAEAAGHGLERMELLRSQPCGSRVGGSARRGPYEVEWTVTPRGPGGTDAVRIVVTIRTPVGQRADTMMSTLPC